MPLSDRLPDSLSDPETYLAFQHFPEGAITIIRTPARQGVPNTLIFENAAEMRETLTRTHPAAEVDRILRLLTKSGRVEFIFSASHRRTQ